jgi:peptide/nickel transport system ATP-binding protein
VSVLEVQDLTIAFDGTPVVQGVSFEIEASTRLGLIGESGSGKTLTALSAIGLTPDAATVTGSVRIDGIEMIGRSDKHWSRLRGERIAMVFQNPQTALNPLMRVGRQIAEPLVLHRDLDRRAAGRRAIELCERVGLPDPERTARAYPHQLSGGQRQRIGIAIALACRPAVLIADEPTTALDVTVQAEVIELLRDMVADAGTALLFITHDLALVAQLCDRLAVMRGGRIVESGSTLDLLSSTTNPYTLELLAAARATGLGADAG